MRYTVEVWRMDWRSIRLFEAGQAPKVRWTLLGARKFRSKAATKRYIERMNRNRPGRARIEALASPEIERRG